MNTDPEKKTGHHLHRITYNHRERVVGFFVFSAFVLLLFFIFISVKNQHLFEKRVTFYIDVDSSEGISQGSIVTALGAEVGLVSSLSLAKGRKIRVAIEVYEGQRALIRKDARVIVNRLTNIGNALIEIESDSVDAPMLTDGALIPVEETPSLNDLLLGIANLIQSADKNSLLSKFEAILPKLERTIENAYKIIEQIATGHGTLGAAIFDQGVEQDLKVVVKSGAELLTEAEGIISIAKQRLVDIEPVLVDAKYVVHDVRGVSQSLPEIVEELKQTIILTRTALTLINEELHQIPGVALDAKRTLTKTEGLVDSVQSTWPLSTDIQKPVSNQLIPPHPIHD